MTRAVGWGLAGVVVVSAVALGLFAPPSWAMPDVVRIPIVSPHGDGPQAPAARFRHGRHAQATCNACHPSLFPRYPLGFTHADMNQGRFCAACHNGSGSPAIADYSCEDCHAP